MSAVLSPCGTYRYRLEREIPAIWWSNDAPSVALIGINPSTADATINDATIRKDLGFGGHHGWGRIIKGNIFAYRATDVSELAKVSDPWGPDNHFHLSQIFAEADIIVPCWGSRSKVPKRLHASIDKVADTLRGLDKPVLIFGLTISGDPKHTLMLGYDTPLMPWAARSPTEQQPKDKP